MTCLDLLNDRLKQVIKVSSSWILLQYFFSFSIYYIGGFHMVLMIVNFWRPFMFWLGSERRIQERKGIERFGNGKIRRWTMPNVALFWLLTFSLFHNFKVIKMKHLSILCNLRINIGNYPMFYHWIYANVQKELWNHKILYTNERKKKKKNSWILKAVAVVEIMLFVVMIYDSFLLFQWNLVALVLIHGTFLLLEGLV